MSNQSVITFRQAQGNFFDRKVVQDALGREVAGAMAKIGGFVRTTAQRSIRASRRLRLSEMPDDMATFYRSNPTQPKPFVSSQPGEPPRARTRRLKRSIFFAFDPHSKSAVVGPVRFLNSRSDHAPSVLEFGGESTVSIVRREPKKTSGRQATEKQAAGLRDAIASGKIKPKERNKPQILEIPVRLEPRPYMRPALNIVRPRIAPQFRNLIRN